MKLTEEQRTEIETILFDFRRFNRVHVSNIIDTLNQIEAIVYPESELLKLPREDK